MTHAGPPVASNACGRLDRAALGGSHPRAFFYPLGFSDPFYSDYLSTMGYPAASQPPVVIMQAPPAAAPEPDHFPSPAQPLMIELQGDRYVRVSGPEASGAEMIQPEEGGQMQATPRARRRPSSAAVPATAGRELAPAVAYSCLPACISLRRPGNCTIEARPDLEVGSSPGRETALLGGAAQRHFSEALLSYGSTTRSR